MSLVMDIVIVSIEVDDLESQRHTPRARVSGREKGDSWRWIALSTFWLL